MKISHAILLAGVFVIVAEIIIFQANLRGYSDTVGESLVNEEVTKKITTLYLLIGIIFFVFGGIVYHIEKKSEQNIRKHSDEKTTWCNFKIRQPKFENLRLN